MLESSYTKGFPTQHTTQTVMKSATAMVVGLVMMLGLSTLNAQNEETPLIPVGSLSAFPTIVQTGTHPTLTWDIVLPEIVDDVVDIEGPGTLVPTRDLVMDVRVVGASVKRVWLNYYGQIVDWEWVMTQLQINYNGEGYSEIFFNTQDHVNPNEIVYSRVVQEGAPVDFGGRYVNSNGSWSTWYSTTNSTNVVALQNGDTPPTTTPMYDQPTIESFILPYLDENGKIKLGARDVIVLMELTHTNPDDGGYDLQDLAVLVTFYDEVIEDDGTTTDASDSSYEHTNNGHGNNDDGVDMSNPGNSKAGEDSDPTVDDESKKRGRRKK